MKLKPRILLGILLILGGGLLILQTTGLISGSWENIFWSVILGTAGLYFLRLFARNRKRWWWLIPGITLLGITAANILQIALPAVAQDYNGLIIMGTIGISFLLIYFSDNLNWWAVIPGGVLITLGIVTVFEETELITLDTGAIFFFGLGLTFLLLAVLPTPAGRLTWAIYPALPLLLVGAFLGYQNQEQVWSYIGPGIIILAGIYFLVSSLRRRS